MAEGAGPVPSNDPTSRTLESLYREIRSLEDKLNIRFAANDEAVKLLQAFANRQPTTESVHENLKALKELMGHEFHASAKLMDARFTGGQTALDAALATRKEATDEIKENFGKQFENLSKLIDGLKERIDRSEGKSTGLSAAGAVILGIASIAVAATVVVGFIIARTN